MFKYFSDEIYFFSISYLFLGIVIPFLKNLNFIKYNIESAGFDETHRKILFGRHVS